MPSAVATTLPPATPPPAAIRPQPEADLAARFAAALRRIGNELHIAHASWQPYAHMLRVWKCVRTALKHPNVAAQGLAFPSHPGLLWSHDALAYASSGLVALSTAVPLAARASADDVRARGALPGWMRALVATRSARSGDEWCRTFARYNNGALPRQWLLLDLKRWWAPAPSGPAALNLWPGIAPTSPAHRNTPQGMQIGFGGAGSLGGPSIDPRNGFLAFWGRNRTFEKVDFF